MVMPERKKKKKKPVKGTVSEKSGKVKSGKMTQWWKVVSTA